MGQFEETGPEYPRPCAGTHEKQSKISVAPHIKWDLTLVRLPSVGWVVAAFSQVLGYWGNLGKLGPNTSKSWPGSKQKVIQRLWLFISHQMRPYSSVKGLWSVDWVLYTISQVLWNCCNLGKLHWNTPNYSQGHMKSNPKSSALHLTSNNVLLLCQGHLRVSYTCLRGIQALGQFGEKGPKYSQIIWSNTWKVFHSFQLHISHQVSFYSSV